MDELRERVDIAHKQFYHGEFDGARQTIKGIVQSMPKDSPYYRPVAERVFSFGDVPFEHFFMDTIECYRQQLTAQAHFDNALRAIHCRLSSLEDANIT